MSTNSYVYHDLEITIERTGPREQTDRVIVREGACGERHGERGRKWRDESVLDIENLRALAEAISQDTARSAHVRKIGESLYRGLCGGAIGQQLNRCIGVALEKEEGVRILLRLRVEQDGDIAQLPWEFLFPPGSEEGLAVSARTPLVRLLAERSTPEQEAEQETKLPVRMLVVIPTCARLPDEEGRKLRVDEEYKILRGGLSGLEQAGQVELRVLDGGVTWRKLKDVLWGRDPNFGEDPFWVVHFIGHGRSRDGVAGIEIDGEDGAPEVMTASDLRMLVKNEWGIRLKLVVLNVCEGAALTAAAPEEASVSVASELVRAGVAAAVAMQYEIEDDEARVFAEEFYRSLFSRPSQGMVEAAVSSARRALWDESMRDRASRRAWGAPVLYTCTSGRLFKPMSGSWVQNVPRTRGEAAAEAEAARGARRALRTLRTLPPSPQTQTLLSSARDELRRARLRLAIRIIVLVGVAALSIGLTALVAGWWYEERVVVEDRLELLTSPVADAIQGQTTGPSVLLVPITGGTLYTVSARFPGTSRMLDGTWRGVHARVLDALSRAGARVVAFDIFFPSATGYDRDFAAAIRDASDRGTKVVVGFESRSGDAPVIAPELGAIGIDTLYTGALCVGDVGGLAARVIPVWIRDPHAGPGLPALATAVAGAYRGARPVGISPSAGRLQFRGPGQSWRIPYAALHHAGPQPDCPAIDPGDEIAEAIVQYSGSPPLLDPEQQLPYEALLSPLSPDDAARVRGAIVLIGSARDTTDLHRVSVGRREEMRYGMEIHAAAIRTLLGGRWLRPAGLLGQFLVISVMAGLGALIAYHSRSRRPRQRLLLLLGAAVAYFTFSLVLQAATGLLLNAVFALLALFLSFYLVRKLRLRYAL